MFEDYYKDKDERERVIKKRGLLSEREKLLLEPEKFFEYLQNKYVFTNPELSNLCKEISDDHREINREEASFREFVLNLGAKDGEDSKKDSDSRLSLWD